MALVNSALRHPGRQCATSCLAFSLVLLFLICIRPATAGTGIASTQPVLGTFENQSDVGDVKRPGSAEFDAAERRYRITASGANIWGKQDAFHFVWRRAGGDFAMTADIHFVGQGKNAHRKGCLMVRQDLDADSAYADVAVHGDGLISLQYRPAKGGLTLEVQSTVKNPATVRLERRGDRFTVSAARPGGTFAAVGSVTLSLHAPAYAGLAVCSHEPDLSETAIFSNVVYSGR